MMLLNLHTFRAGETLDFSRFCASVTTRFGTCALATLFLGSHVSAQMIDLHSLSASNSFANGLSADGSTVVGDAGNSSTSGVAFRWTAAGMQSLGTLGGNNSTAAAVSGDGSVVVGRSFLSDNVIYRAFRWTQGGTMTDLGTLGGASSYARGLSANGAVVVGESLLINNSSHAFRWTPSGGMQDLNTLGGADSAATGISADGSTIIGNSNFELDNQALHAFRWTQTGGMVDLGTLGGASSLAAAVSANGSTVVGRSFLSDNVRSHAYRWTAATGMQDLGSFDGTASTATAVSADGTVVVGSGDTLNNAAIRAFRWSTTSSFQDIGTLGGRSAVARTVSADGSTIVGLSNDANGATRAFRWKTGRMQDLGTLGGVNSNAEYVSADGSVVAGSSQTGSGATHAFIWRALQSTPGGPPGIILDLDHTQEQVAQIGFDTHRFLAHQNASARALLDYDCSVFSMSDICVGTIGRSTLNDGSSDFSTALVGAYRVSTQFRVGAAIDYTVYQNVPLVADSVAEVPRVSMFGIYEAQPDGSGLQLQAALSWFKGDVSLCRPGHLANTEQGYGEAETSSFAARAKIGYGFNMGNDWIAEPFIGLTYATATRKSYRETEDAQAFPFSYGDVSMDETIAEAGVRLSGEIAPGLGLLMGAGVEADLNRNTDAVTIASELPGLTQVSMIGNEASSALRPWGHIGLTYQLSANERLTASLNIRSQSYSDVPQMSVTAGYRVGF